MCKWIRRFFERKNMSLPKCDVRGKILPEAKAVIEMLAIAKGESQERIVSDIVNTACLGAGYKEMLAAERYKRLGEVGNFRDAN